MGKLVRWTGYALVTFAGLLFISVAAIWVISSIKLHQHPTSTPEHLLQPTSAQLADAERQGRVLGCFGCHGEGLRGSKMFDDPNIATVYAPNLTRIAARATDQQLARAIRQGIGTDGRPLFIMQSQVYQHLSDQEVAALIQMIRKLPRQGVDVPANSFGPIGRLGLVLGKFKSAPQLVAEYAAAEPVRVGTNFDPGHRLSVLNCSGCHGAGLDGNEASPGEMAPDLSIASAYDPGAFKTLLKTGRPADGHRLRLMEEVAKSDLSHMTDAEIDQLYRYLKARAARVSN